MARESVHQRVERERKEAAPAGAAWSRKSSSWTILDEFRDYARGKQRKTLNADQMRIMSPLLKHDFADNVLKLILWTHANRLRLARFDVEDDDVSQFLYTTWVKNQLPDLFTDVIYATLRDGNHAIMLNWELNDDPDDVYGGRVVLSRERWWNGRDGIFVMYGDNNQPVYAVKEWTPLGPEPKKRRTIYYPDSMFRYVQDGGEWMPFTLPGEETLEPRNAATGLPVKGIVPWLKRDGSPLGIPVVHFANGSDDDSPYGASLLDGGPLAFQDQINAVQHDITAAALMTGSPQTTSKGFELPDDPQNTGEKVKVRTGPGVHHHVPDITAEWGTIAPGDMSQLVDNGYMTKVKALCRNTNTPLHEITGDWPSGDALFRADLPLINSVKKLGESVGPSTSTVAHRATEIENAFGLVELDENALIQTLFEPPEQRDPLSTWAVVEKAAPFVSEREALRLAGYTPTQIDTILEEKGDENAEKVAAAQAAFARPADLNSLQAASGQSLDTTQTGNENANANANE